MNMEKNIDLTISIVNWNVKEYLERCLESIFRYSQGIELEVIVVDNASHDGSVEMVKEKFPRVQVIANKENAGYGSAHNQAIKIARGKYILLLNPDTEMLPETLPKMLAFMDGHPEAGACMGIEISTKEKAEYKKVFVIERAVYRKWKLFSFLHRFFPVPALTEYCLKFFAQNINESRKKYSVLSSQNLEAGNLLVRMEALQQVGLFDPQHFLGFEEEELTGRMREHGWKLYAVPSITLVHYHSRSLNQISDAQIEVMEKNWKKMVDKYGPDDIYSKLER